MKSWNYVGRTQSHNNKCKIISKQNCYFCFIHHFWESSSSHQGVRIYYSFLTSESCGVYILSFLHLNFMRLKISFNQIAWNIVYCKLAVLTFELWLCLSSCDFWLTHFNTYSSFYQFQNDNVCSHKDLIWHNFLLHYFLSSQVHPQFASIVQIIQWNKNYILPNMEKTKNNVQIFTPYRLIQKHNHDKNVMKS